MGSILSNFCGKRQKQSDTRIKQAEAENTAESLLINGVTTQTRRVSEGSPPDIATPIEGAWTSTPVTSNVHQRKISHNYIAESPSQLPSENTDEDIVVCLFDFTARVRSELNFKTHDRLKILRKEDEDWLYALHLDNNQKGLIPSKYVASDQSLESFGWYFGDVSRRKAEALLNRPENEPGMFLVRNSSTKHGFFALSIKDFDHSRGHHVKHYIIRFMNEKYSIFNKIKYSTLNSLIEEYKVSPHGIAVALTTPCAKIMPTQYDLSATTRDDWEIDRTEIGLLEEVGYGYFGSVYRALWIGAVEVAVKTLKIGKMSSAKFLEEAKIMKGLRHENILVLLATCSKEEPFYIITEFMKLGSLLSFVRNHKAQQKTIEVDQMLGFAFQIAKGMEYLEQKKLVHRDLAARNVLVNEVPICKIADFGLAKIIEEESIVYGEDANEQRINGVVSYPGVPERTATPFTPTMQPSHGSYPQLQNIPGANSYPGNTPTPTTNQRKISKSVPELPSPTNPKDEIVICLFDFTARVDRELSFQTNDRLKIIRREDSDWLYALHLVNNNSGLVPSNYVASEESLESYDWYFGELTRRNALTLLNRPQIDVGTFLVRNSETSPGHFALAIKAYDTSRGYHVKHYKVKFEDGQYSIHKVKFSTLNGLLEEYKERRHGIALTLGTSCPKVMPTRYDLSFETRDMWEIERKEIELQEEIGHGNFGSVYRGVWRGTTEVAIKTLKTGKMSSATFLEEAKIMKGLRHENILALLATCSNEEPFYIITEFMKLGSLLSLLRSYKVQHRKIEEDQMLDFAYQISRGMEYLEQKRLVHRDLAARNVLVNDVPMCKIADFGLAKIVEEEGGVCKEKFPVKWAPPETFLRGEFSIKSDVWAFGIVVVEIFTYGDPVYTNMTPKEVQLNVKNGYRLPRPGLMPEPTYEVLQKCWSRLPENRPEFAALAKFFSETTQKFEDGTQYLTEEVHSSLQV